MGQPDGARILAVGDSLHTDIAGGNAAGVDTALITGGIHCQELGAPWGEAADPARVLGHGHRRRPPSHLHPAPLRLVAGVG
jgi:ribonucleotide monophosphatase NagD (HAD superfamily)